MKPILLIAFFTLPFTSTGQIKKIAAKQASKFVGERVSVRDSVYAGEVINDSTAIYYLGAKANKHPFVVIHTVRAPFVLSRQSEKYIRTLQIGRVVFTGTIFLIQETPAMLIRGIDGFGLEVPTPDKYMPYTSGKP